MTSNEFEHLGEIECVLGEHIKEECNIFQDAFWYASKIVTCK